MWSFLNKPFPIVSRIRDQLWMNAGFLLYILVFMGVFKPFGVDIFHSSLHFYRALEASMISFVVVSLNGIGLRMWLSHGLDERNWKVSSALLYTIWSFSAVVVALTAYAYFVGIASPTWYFIAIGSLKLGAITVIPAGLFLMWLYLRTLQAHIRQAQKWSAHLAEPHPAVVQQSHERDEPLFSVPITQTLDMPCKPQNVVVLNSENMKESFEIASTCLRYMVAADNYVQVHYMNEHGILSQYLFRSTLKKVEVELGEACAFFRCHRAYIVNLEEVEEVLGNAQGYRLKLKDIPTPIPVSRRFQPKLAERMTKAGYSGN
ncbi:MAG: LytTR family transcriptional regulator [Bacteroidetes Order II. Incertae sedis bacterium]|nr:LytTR family transcriptional regulator [Bacteroidetes Order II. bacterium]